MRMRSASVLWMCVALSASAVAQDKAKSVAIPRGTSAADATTFMAAAEKELGDLQVKANQAQWVTENFITDDTEAISAELTKNLTPQDLADVVEYMQSLKESRK